MLEIVIIHMDVYHTSIIKMVKQNVAIFQKKILENINVYYNAWNMMVMKTHVKRNIENADILENTGNQVTPTEMGSALWSRGVH